MAGEKKQRADLLLVEQSLVQSRSRAKALIMAGRVRAKNTTVNKAGDMLPADVKLSVIGSGIPYVGRGGLKLEKALNEFGISLAEKTVIDIGASTGGFTDCALQQGAKKVYAVDVGYGQLAWKLRQDSRVVVMERQNIRYLDPAAIKDDLDFASVDVAFISLELVLPVLAKIQVPEAVLLIKPQFEAGRQKVGKGGVVRSGEVHAEVIGKIIAAAAAVNLQSVGLTYSPIKGTKGNVEYLLHLQQDPAYLWEENVTAVIAQALAALN